MKSTRSIKKIKGGDDIDFSIFGLDFIKLQTNIDYSININIQDKNHSYISSININNDAEIYKFINSYLEIYYMNFAILCVKYMQANITEINAFSNPYFQQWKTEMFKDTIKIFIPRIKKFIDFIILYNLVLYYLNVATKDENKKFIKENILDSVSLDNLSATITTPLDLLKTIIKNINSNTDITSLNLYDKLKGKFDNNSILTLTNIPAAAVPPAVPPVAPPGGILPPDVAVPPGGILPPGAGPPVGVAPGDIPPVVAAPPGDIPPVVAAPPGDIPPDVAVPPPGDGPPDGELAGGATKDYNILNNLRISLLNVFFEANKEYLKNIINNFYEFFETNKTIKIFN